jgi:hypothetical protein
VICQGFMPILTGLMVRGGRTQDLSHSGNGFAMSNPSSSRSEYLPGGPEPRARKIAPNRSR